MPSSRLGAPLLLDVSPCLLGVSGGEAHGGDEESGVDAVVYDMMPLLPDVSFMRPWCLRSRAARTPAAFIKVARSARAFQAHCVGLGVGSSLLITRTSRPTSHMSQDVQLQGVDRV